MIVEDGIIDELGQSNAHGGGPEKAIKNYLDIYSEFVIDIKWINMFRKSATFNTLVI